ncbi:hypothetical protein L596_008741 [Steinernema carpocapsae]|uniref:G-protein coupled receptors family 1 profile domain-containing protein n=1 Tax=Steinernema carpocapsae TaxID=34508 RepID=A0A4V6XWL5_STECR|nr:hypothetical protein L596_008741 [Steinernema carpocapsae]
MVEIHGITHFELVIRPYLELIVYLTCVVVSILAFVPYFKYRKNSNYIGALLLFMISCFLCSIIQCVDPTIQVMESNGLKSTFLHNGSKEEYWFFLARTTSFNFIYVTGTFLALDRVLVLTFPTKYTIRGLQRKCVISAVAMCALTFGFLFGTHAFVDYTEKENHGHFATETAVRYVGIILDVPRCVVLSTQFRLPYPDQLFFYCLQAEEHEDSSASVQL